jgi:hypothetical protein
MQEKLVPEKSLCLLNYRVTMKTYRGVTSALEGDELSDSRSGHFTSEESPGIHLIRDWTGPTAGPDAVEKREISVSLRNGTPFPLSSDPWCTYWNIPVYYCNYLRLQHVLYMMCENIRSEYVNIAAGRIEIFLFLYSRFCSPPCWGQNISSGSNVLRILECQ